MICCLVADFEHDNKSFEIEERPGLPRHVNHPEMVKKINDVLHDRRVQMEEIAITVGMSIGVYTTFACQFRHA